MIHTLVAPRKYTETIRMPLRNALLEKIAGSTIGGRPRRLYRRSQAHQAPSTSRPAGNDIHTRVFTSRSRKGSMISRIEFASSTVNTGPRYARLISRLLPTVIYLTESIII